MHKIAMLTTSALLGGCAAHVAAAPEPAEPARVAGGGTCDASAVQGHIGERATPDLAAKLLAETGSQSLRWLPPRSPMTMDYRKDRLNIEYDDDYAIKRIFCG